LVSTARDMQLVGTWKAVIVLNTLVTITEQHTSHQLMQCL